MKHFSVPRVIAITCVISFVLLASAVQSLPHAGQSSYVLVQKLGIDPFPNFLNPIYGYIVQTLAFLGGSHTFHLINLFSAICAAGALGFVFALAYRGARLFNVEHSFPPALMHRVQLGASLAAVLYLLAAEPFWMAATRAGPHSFDLLLLLFPFYLAFSAKEKESESRLLLSCALYGIAMVEFSTAILLLPLFAFLVLARFYEANVLTPALITKAALCGAAGLLLFFVQAGIYMTTPAYEWREFKHVFQLFRYMALDHYHALTRGVPRVGWLTMAMISIVPFVVTTAFRIPAGPGRGQGPIVGTASLNVILAALGILLLTNVPLAPKNITGSSVLYLTPYVLIALWFANVTAFWLVLLFRKRRFEDAWSTRARSIIGIAYAVILPLLLAGFVFMRSMPAAREGRGEQRLIHQFVQSVVDQCRDSEWLISNSPADDLIALEIRRRESPLKLVRLDYGRSRASMKYIASLFSGNPRLQSLARVGMEPLLDEWLPSATNAPGNIKILNVADLWLVSGFEAVPERVVFSGLLKPSAGEVTRIFNDAQSFWNAGGKAFLADDRGDAPSFYLDWIRAHLSKLANNLGIILEDVGQPDQAMECYRQARAFYPENLSALMNMHVLAQRESRPEFAELEKELVNKTEGLMGNVKSVSLAQTYGFVRVPELFVNRGMTFARSGNMQLAISDLRRALKLGKDNPQVELALAELYMGSDQDLKSREHYLAVLEKEPANPQALNGLMRLALRARDYTEVRRLLDVLRASGVPPESLRMEDAFLEVVDGSAVKGLEMMEAIVRDDPKNVRAWAGIAALAADLKIPEKVQTAKEKLDEAGVFVPAVQLVLAQSALNQKDADSARTYLNEVLRRLPDHVVALEMLLRLELSVGTQRDDARRLVQQILNIDPRNALANYMLGVEHYMNEEYLLAESAYRVSVDTQRTPEALNDLAYILHLQGRDKEAEPYVRDSLTLNAANGSAWDTLGVVLMSLGQFEESEAALNRALGLKPDNAGIMLSLALLHEKQERFDDAEKVARAVNARQNELGPAEQTKIRELIQRLDRRR